MARPKKETDLRVQVLQRYEELLAERNEIDKERKALQGYLKYMGEATTQRRKSRKERKAPESKKKTSATATIVSLIEKHKEGISIDRIMKVAGVGRQTVNGVLNRMKKAGKVKALKRGVYVKA